VAIKVSKFFFKKMIIIGRFCLLLNHKENKSERKSVS